MQRACGFLNLTRLAVCTLATTGAGPLKLYCARRPFDQSTPGYTQLIDMLTELNINIATYRTPNGQQVDAQKPAKAHAFVPPEPHALADHAQLVQLLREMKALPVPA